VADEVRPGLAGAEGAGVFEPGVAGLAGGASSVEELLDPHGLVLEIDLLDVRPGRKTAPVRRHDLESIGERFLGAPGQVRVDHGTVN
jgi:hypothetical protein